jgi:hypothetical protein
MAGTFHRLAQERYPVGSNFELIEDTPGEPDVNDPYRRPIAASYGTQPPEWDMAALTGIIGALATGLSRFMDAYVGETAVTPVEEKGLVVFADDVVDCSAVFDLEQVAEMIGEKGKPVNKVVLYARTPDKAAVVENVLRAGNSRADIRVVLRQDLADHCGDDFFSMPETQALLRYTMNRNSGNIFRRSEDILGIVRGPLREGEDMEDIKNGIRTSSLRVPVVMFRDSAPGNVYSLREAVSRLMKIRNSDDIREMVFILPPVTRISETLQERYHQYINMIRALEAAA